MSRLLIASNGSQGIQLIRELFASNYRPDELFVISDSGRYKQNMCFIEFLEYYGIPFCHTLEIAHIHQKRVVIDEKDLM